MADRSDSLTLIITGEVTFPRLLSAGQSFFKIVREVERGIGGTQKESVYMDSIGSEEEQS